MFEADRQMVFAAVDQERRIVIYQTMAYGGGPENPGGEVWFIYVARSAGWALQFAERGSRPGETKRQVRLQAGRGDLPTETQCREIVMDFIRFETDRLHHDWGLPESASDIEISVGGQAALKPFGEEGDRYPASLYGF